MAVPGLTTVPGLHVLNGMTIQPATPVTESLVELQYCDAAGAWYSLHVRAAALTDLANYAMQALHELGMLPRRP